MKDRPAGPQEQAVTGKPPEMAMTPDEFYNRPAKVARVVGDLVMATASPRGADNTSRLPAVGETVEFSGGAVAYVVALSDMCFAAAKCDPEAAVAADESYTILSGSRATVAMPPAGSTINWLGQRYSEDAEMQPLAADATKVYCFNEMMGINKRQRIHRSLHTGVMAIDAFVPIGRGQSMAIRLPPGISEEQLRRYMTHVIRAQEGNDLNILAPTCSPEEARMFRGLVGDIEPASRLTIVAGRDTTDNSLGEAVMAINSATGMAERIRDEGGDALLLLDLEPLYRMWAVLEEVAAEQGMAEIAMQNQDAHINAIPEKDGGAFWKYIARSNASTGRRRTFLGCFLQRAAQLSPERGGGSLSMLCFVRQQDDSQTSRRDLEAKLNNLKQMKLDDAMRKRAIDKVEAQLAELADDHRSAGVPDDFIEESKATTDGHLQFVDEAATRADKPLRWCIDMQESVARGITSITVQNQQLHLLRSLNLKLYLMSKFDDKAIVRVADTGVDLDKNPLMALLDQPVDDVLSQADEAALLLLAMSEGAQGAAAKPLAEAALALLHRARVRTEGKEAARRRSAATLAWALAQVADDPALAGLQDFGPDLEAAVDSLCDAWELKPLERKRVHAEAKALPAEAEAGELASSVERLVAPDPIERYAELRQGLDFLRLPQGAGELLQALEQPDQSDAETLARLGELRERICGAA